MWRALLSLSIAEWRHHPWRHGVALLAVALGVALASSVQMINESALAEFSQALRAVNGQPDAVLAATGREGFADTIYARLALDESVALVSPVLEIDSQGRRDGAGVGSANVALRIVGVDALKVAAIAPGLMPRPEPAPTGSDAGAASVLAPDAVFLNPAASAALALKAGDSLALQSATGWQRFRVVGSVAAGGAPLVVVDIAAAQARFDRAGRLSRLDLKLQTGVDPRAWQQGLAAWPAGVRWASPDDSVQRVSNLSRAYRVNLGVLAGVALLVGGFLVYSVVSLSVAQRTPSLALLGVLGLAARDRRSLVLVESAVVGAVGSLLGLAAGAGLAALALQLLGGDLGGGYFAGGAPQLAWPWAALTACGLLGLAAAVVGAWWPARQAERLAPALALKGLGAAATGAARVWPGAALLLIGGALALLPPLGGLPLAAYAAVAALLAGGVVLVPALVQGLLSSRFQPRQAVLLLAWRRARFARQTASATVAGVVASLALSVAITVMVASFRGAVVDWLGSVLPADLYLRTGGSAASADQVFLAPDFVASAARLDGVTRVQATRLVALQLRPQLPAVTLLARPLGPDPAATLPMLGPVLPRLPAGELAVYVSEPAASIYGWQLGDRIRLPITASAAPGIAAPNAAAQDGVTVRISGIWRDYARQAGAIAIDATDYQGLTGDTRVNDLALWLKPGSSAAEVETALRRIAGPDLALEAASTASLRTLSMRIFDRSFAVTFYLQAVAIAVGLVGVAASLSAQVLARRKEFGLLAHLGLTRSQVIALVGLEAAAWLAAGTLIGLALGLAMAVVLVQVVNPQSFHWTMPLQVPWDRLAALAGAVLVAGILTALWSARRAAGHSAVVAVKEDW
jgi:putative ABC transport system permease protein